MANKFYIILYLISLGLSILNHIITSTALATGLFIELNPIGYNLIIFILTILLYLFLLVPLFIKDKLYKTIFLIGIAYVTLLNIGVCIHDMVVVNDYFKIAKITIKTVYMIF